MPEMHQNSPTAIIFQNFPVRNPRIPVKKEKGQGRGKRGLGRERGRGRGGELAYRNAKL